MCEGQIPDRISLPMLIMLIVHTRSTLLSLKMASVSLVSRSHEPW
jgi:hypothetical protein